VIFGSLNAFRNADADHRYLEQAQKNMKKLENEKLGIQQANVQHEVSYAVGRKIKKILGRIEVLEAIVTDRKFDLSEKINRLK
jgi:hypothetical protein